MLDVGTNVHNPLGFSPKPLQTQKIQVVETDLRALQSQVSIGPDGRTRDVACIWATPEFMQTPNGKDALFRGFGNPKWET